MPNTVLPSRVKALINSLTGLMCERMSKLFQFTNLLDEDVTYYVNEAGLPADGFKADLCEALSDCIGTGGGTPNPSMPAPTGVNATDGSYSDKIRVSWNAVTAPDGIAAVTQYKVYRSLSTNTDPNNAALVGTVTAPTILLDDPVDADLVVGSTYNYWVKATNGTDVSAFSGRDVGSADAPTGDIDAVNDLRASVGFGDSFIRLVWTPPAGASTYDIWRGTTNVFGSATKIYAGIAPASTNQLSHPTMNPTFWDNLDELVAYDTPPSAIQDYYYWVVAKKSSPPAVSAESNSALGRVSPPAVYNAGSTLLDFTTPSRTIPGGITKLRVVAFGSGGGGAGGSGVYGGGGGGGGAVLIRTFTVAPGDVIDLTVTGPTPDSGNAASTDDGDDGAILELLINSVSQFTLAGGHGGQYSTSGDGVGGAGETATSSGSPTIYDGHAGEDADGASGGRSGYSFGSRRTPQADAFGIFNGDGYIGSGAKAISFNPALSVGGYGLAGSVLLQYGA